VLQLPRSGHDDDGEGEGEGGYDYGGGDPDAIGAMFKGFQRHLYQQTA
jgi:hypothetical protein